MINEGLAPCNKGEETKRLRLDLQWYIPVLVDDISIFPMFSYGTSYLDNSICSAGYFALKSTSVLSMASDGIWN